MDRISNLPCNVIDDIMERLTLHEAARTSILSRQWRYKWRYIPYLVFYQNFQKKLRGKYTAASIIYQVLLLHKVPIVKFVVNSSVKRTSRISCSADVDHWLHFLSNHPIEELSLEFSNKTIPKIPNHLFSFGELKHLKLAYCNLKLPCSFKGFGRLVILDLCNVTIEDKELRIFISKSPLLEDLTLKGDGFSCLAIDAPNLKSFNLVVDTECPWHLGCDEFFPSKIPNGTLMHLSRLICHVPFVEPTAVECVVRFIGKFTTLQCLHIIADTDVHDDNSLTIEYLQERQELNYSLCHLKHVKIDNFAGGEVEMEFVKLILLAATSLVTLELKLRPNLEGSSSEEGYMMFRSLATFRRASANVQIII